MNSPIALDEQGHILVNDSMSDELKEKIALYNQLGDTEILEEELPEGDMPLDASDEIPEDSDDSFDEGESSMNYGSDAGTVEAESQVQVSEEELDSLNDLFN